ncbi:MAG: M56 family metallopeptidase, partial [Gemmatimonadota bacterium]
PTRGAWLGALLLTLALPAAMLVLPRPAPPAPPQRTAAPADLAGERMDPAELPLGEASRPRVDLAALDRPLVLGWGAASGATLLALLAMAAVLRRRRSGWRAAELAGVPVLISRDTGPAVVGLVRSRIVLPEWAAGADPERRDLLLEHETEHLRAGDPRLLAVGLFALVLAPWNPAVWWQLRRLRLAVEIDCDARVLRRRGDVRAYGSLLLEVGRRAGGSALAVAAFSEPASFLERRIRIMTQPRERSPWTRAAGFGALALGLGAAACETPAPTSLAPAPVERVYSAADAPQGLQQARLTPREAVTRHFPEVLTEGVEPNTVLTFVVDHRGEVVHSSRARAETFVASQGGDAAARIAPAPDGAGTRVRLRGSSVMAEVAERPRFRMSAARDVEVDPGQIESVDVMKFRPGMMGPGAVDVIWIRKRDPAAPPAPAKVRAPAPGGEAARELVVSPSRGEAALRRRTADGDEEVSGAHIRVSGDRVTATSTPDTTGQGRALLRYRPRSPEGAPTDEIRAVALRTGRTDPAVIVQAVEKHHPGVARGQASPEMLWFVVGADGEVVRTGTDRNADFDRYAPESIESVEVFKGDRIQVNGRSVSVLWMVLKA